MEYPRSFEVADRAAQAHQRRFKMWKLLEYGSMLLAAVAGLVSPWLVGTVNVWALCVAVALAAALLVLLVEKALDPRENWYRSRALAEAVKAETWRFACAGGEYRAGLPQEQAVNAFCSRVGVLHAELDSAQATAQFLALGPEVTEEMLRLRAASFEERRSTLRTERVLDQAEWYAAHAKVCSAKGHGLLVFSVVLLLIGLVLAVLQTLDLMGGTDVVTALAAGAITLTGWSQFRRFDTLSLTYGRAANELNSLAELVSAAATQQELENILETVESSTSKEHRVWVSRGELTR